MTSRIHLNLKLFTPWHILILQTRLCSLEHTHTHTHLHFGFPLCLNFNLAQSVCEGVMIRVMESSLMYACMWYMLLYRYKIESSPSSWLTDCMLVGQTYPLIPHFSNCFSSRQSDLRFQEWLVFIFNPLDVLILHNYDPNKMV